MNGIFKSVIPEHGKLKHKHGTTRTAVDYKVPKLEGVKGSVQGLHRQIGPGHDLGRFKEALDLMSGKKTDFPLWGKTISEQTGGILHPGNMQIMDFINKGGFKIPEDPKAELMNHLLIDFFTKTSLPLPFTSYLADYSPFLGKLMINMYGEGLNLKNLTGNMSSLAMLQLITHSYAYLFKSTKQINFYKRLSQISASDDLRLLVNDLNYHNKEYTKSKEFNVLQIIAHGSSFLVDSIITVASKNYAGLFSLDYGTLICFATNVIKYIKQDTADYSLTLNKVADVNNGLIQLDHLWYDSFKQDVLRIAQSSHFYETFNPELIIAHHREIIEKLDEMQEKSGNMLTELKEWNV